MAPLTVVSGGQTGVDRAALDIALELGLPCGGWCPRGRRAEDGRIPRRYPLRETPSAAYPQRTEWNVRDSDATLLLTWGRATGGSLLTLRLARSLGRPVLVVDLTSARSAGDAAAWIERHRVRTLNVAGPRDSAAGEVYANARAFLEEIVGALAPTPAGESAAEPASDHR